MYKWYFDGLDIKFISTEENMGRHVLNQRSKLGQPDTKIIIENEYFDLDQSPTAGCASCNSNSTSPALPTVPVDTKKGKAKSKAVQLPDLSESVSDADPAINVLEDGTDPELPNGVNDRLAL